MERGGSENKYIGKNKNADSLDCTVMTDCIFMSWYIKGVTGVQLLMLAFSSCCLPLYVWREFPNHKPTFSVSHSYDFWWKILHDNDIALMMGKSKFREWCEWAGEISGNILNSLEIWSLCLHFTDKEAELRKILLRLSCSFLLTLNLIIKLL